MKFLKSICALLVLLSTLATTRAAVLVTDFGFNALNGGSWTYTPATSTISGTEGLGDLIYQAALNLDLGSNRSIQLTGNASVAPAGSFTITLEDNVGNTAFAPFLWTQFTGGSTRTQSLNYTTFNFSQVVGWSLDSGASLQAVNASFSQLSAVPIPEPSTGALALASLLSILAFAALSRRQHNTLTTEK